MDMDTVFADGTPSNAAAFDMDTRKINEWEDEFKRTTGTRRRKLEANPAAATIHKREAGAPWRRKYEREIDEDNKIAEVEIQKKRVILLSQQTCKGMAKNYGVNYDPTEFANILNQAFKVRARNRQAAAQRSAAAGGNGQTTARSRRTHGGETGRRGSTRRGSTRRGSQHTRASADEDSEASESDLRALQVLEAVLKFEIKKVIDLLKLRPVDNSDQVLATRTVVFTGTFDPSKSSASS